MDREELIALVTREVLEVLGRGGYPGGSQPVSRPPDGRASMHLSGNLPLSRSLLLLEEEGSEVPGILPGGESAEGVLIWKPGSPALAPEVFQRIEVCMVPVLSMTSLGKFVHLIWDTAFLGILGWMASSGKHVVVSAEVLEAPQAKPHGFTALLREYRRIGEGLGLTFGNVQKVYEERAAAGAGHAEIAPHQVLTRDDVMELSRSGKKEFLLNPGAIVTPLAREIADGLGMTFKRLDRGHR